MSDTQPADLIRNEQELLALTGAVDTSFLADLLWQYVDGVVNFFDGGIDLQPGFQHESLSYPFTLEELYELALQLEESEVSLQAATGVPAPAVTLSKARVAKNARDAFAPESAKLAEAVLGAEFRVFAPRPMTTFAWWYENSEATKLVAVVAPTEVSTVTDEVLAFALAWQHDRELILVLADKHSREVARRLPWIAGPVTVRSFEGDTVEMSRESVLANDAALKNRTTKPHTLDSTRTAWIERLLTDPSLEGLEAHARASYLSWHSRGLQVLRVTASRSGLRLEAGVQYTRPQSGHKVFNTMLTAPLTDDELALAVEAVAGSVAAGGSLTSRQTEHRLQSSMGLSPPPPLGLPFLAREYPGYRGPGRPGFIDFLGSDPAGNLHVVETKVGHDPKVVLQALDYGIWVLANEQSLRTRLPDWPRPAAPQSRIHLDFVLAASDQSTALNSYLAGQLEVLTGDIHWRVFVVHDLDAHPVVLTQVPAGSLWEVKTGVTSQPVRPRRGTPLG